MWFEHDSGFSVITQRGKRNHEYVTGTKGLPITVDKAKMLELVKSRLYILGVYR